MKKKNVILLLTLILIMTVMFTACNSDNFSIEGSATVIVNMDKVYEGLNVDCPDGEVHKDSETSYSISFARLKQVQVVISCNGYYTQYKNISSAELASSPTLNLTLEKKTYSTTIEIENIGDASQVKLYEVNKETTAETEVPIIIEGNTIKAETQNALERAVLKASGYKDFYMDLPEYVNYDLNINVPMVSNDSNKFAVVIFNDLVVSGEVSYTLKFTDVLYGNSYNTVKINNTISTVYALLEKDKPYILKTSQDTSLVISQEDYIKGSYETILLSTLIPEESIVTNYDNYIITDIEKDSIDETNILNANVWLNNSNVSSVTKEEIVDSEGNVVSVQYFMSIPNSAKVDDVIFFNELKGMTKVTLTQYMITHKTISYNYIDAAEGKKDVSINFFEDTGEVFNNAKKPTVYIYKNDGTSEQKQPENGKVVINEYSKASIKNVIVIFDDENYEEFSKSISSEQLQACDEINCTLYKLFNVKIKYLNQDGSAINRLSQNGKIPVGISSSDIMADENDYFSYSLKRLEEVTTIIPLTNKSMRKYSLIFAPEIFEYNQEDNCYYYTINMQNQYALKINLDIENTPGASYQEQFESYLGQGDGTLQSALSYWQTQNPNQTRYKNFYLEGRDEDDVLLRYTSTFESQLSNIYLDNFGVYLYTTDIGHDIYYSLECFTSESYLLLEGRLTITQDILDAREATLVLQFTKIDYQLESK